MLKSMLARLPLATNQRRSFDNGTLYTHRRTHTETHAGLHIPAAQSEGVAMLNQVYVCVCARVCVCVCQNAGAGIIGPGLTPVDVTAAALSNLGAGVNAAAVDQAYSQVRICTPRT